MNITELMTEAHNTAAEKGWWETDRNFMECLMLTVSELSEAGEEYRVNGLNPKSFIYKKDGKPEGIAVEFADVFIRIADVCAKHNIPLEQALIEKLAYNKTRPHRHGGKIC